MPANPGRRVPWSAHVPDHHAVRGNDPTSISGQPRQPAWGDPRRRGVRRGGDGQAGGVAHAPADPVGTPRVGLVHLDTEGAELVSRPLPGRRGPTRVAAVEVPEFSESVPAGG